MGGSGGRKVRPSGRDAQCFLNRESSASPASCPAPGYSLPFFPSCPRRAVDFMGLVGQDDIPVVVNHATPTFQGAPLAAVTHPGCPRILRATVQMWGPRAATVTAEQGIIVTGRGVHGVGNPGEPPHPWASLRKIRRAGESSVSSPGELKLERQREKEGEKERGRVRERPLPPPSHEGRIHTTPAEARA